MLAIDRPGYGDSSPLPVGRNTLRDNADFLAKELRAAWEAHGGGTRSVFLIGHRIGAGIAMMVAAQPFAWPLLGLAVRPLRHPGLREVLTRVAGGRRRRREDDPGDAAALSPDRL